MSNLARFTILMVAVILLPFLPLVLTILVQYFKLVKKLLGIFVLDPLILLASRIGGLTTCVLVALTIMSAVFLLKGVPANVPALLLPGHLPISAELSAHYEGPVMDVLCFLNHVDSRWLKMLGMLVLGPVLFPWMFFIHMIMNYAELVTVLVIAGSFITSVLKLKHPEKEDSAPSLRNPFKKKDDLQDLLDNANISVVSWNELVHENNRTI